MFPAYRESWVPGVPSSEKEKFRTGSNITFNFSTWDTSGSIHREYVKNEDKFPSLLLTL